MRHLNKTEYRIYETRYLIRGDELIGRLDLTCGAFEFEPGMDQHRDTAFAFIAQTFGVPVKEAKDIRPDPMLAVKPLPAEIAALKRPDLGMRTPEVQQWIAANRPDDYVTLYGVAVPVEPDPINIVVPVEKPRRQRGKRNTAPVDTADDMEPDVQRTEIPGLIDNPEETM